MSSAAAESIDEFLEPVEHASLRQQHLAVLGLSIGVIVLALSMMTINDRQVAFAGFSQFPLPDVCQSRIWLRMDCPGCGLTRSFIHFFHGRWSQSFQMHRFGWLLASLTVVQIPYRLAALTRANGLPLGKIFPQALGIGLVTLLAVNWLLKLGGV
jgi:hypothetical protein